MAPITWVNITVPRFYWVPCTCNTTPSYYRGCVIYIITTPSGYYKHSRLTQPLAIASLVTTPPRDELYYIVVTDNLFIIIFYIDNTYIYI